MPTAEANALYSESRFLFEGLTRLGNRVEALQKGAGQTLTVMCINMLTRHFLPQAILRVLEDLPEINLNLDVGTMNQQLQALRAGHVDLCFVAGLVQAEDVRLERVGRGRLRLLVPPDSALAGLDRVPMSALRDITLLGSTLRGPVGKVLARALEGHDVDFSAQVMINSLTLVPSLCQALNAASVVDEFTLAPQDLGDFRVVPFEPEVSFDIYAMTLGQIRPGSAARMFIHEMRELLSEWEAGARPPLAEASQPD